MAIVFGGFRVSLVLAGAVTVLMWPHAGTAYTPEQRQACAPDAMRLCFAHIPDVDRIKACMIRNKSQLSPLAARSSGRGLKRALRADLSIADHRRATGVRFGPAASAAAGLP